MKTVASLGTSGPSQGPCCPAGHRWSELTVKSIKGNRVESNRGNFLQERHSQSRGSAQGDSQATGERPIRLGMNEEMARNTKRTPQAHSFAISILGGEKGALFAPVTVPLEGGLAPQRGIEFQPRLLQAPWAIAPCVGFFFSGLMGQNGVGGGDAARELENGVDGEKRRGNRKGRPSLSVTSKNTDSFFGRKPKSIQDQTFPVSAFGGKGKCPRQLVLTG